MRILIITEHFPYPPIAGTPVRTYNLLSRLAASGHDIWLASFVRAPGDAEAERRMREICRGVVTKPIGRSRAWDRPVEALQYLLRGRPFELRLYMSDEFASRIRELVAQVDFDVVEIIDSYMALYLEVLPEELQRRTVLTFIDVVYSRAERISRLDMKAARRLRNRIYGWMMRRFEPRYAGRFARCIAVSASDRDLLLAQNLGLSIAVIPNGVDARGLHPIAERADSKSLILVGNMGYQPNVDAAVWFCERIFPLIRREAPEVDIWIVGKDPAAAVLGLEKDSIHITGRVDDIGPYYERSAISVVPLRGGGGTRLKILEAMALGRPVVSTTIGCEGLNVRNGAHLLIADTEEEFAASVVRLLRSREERRQLAQTARKLVEDRYDWTFLVKQLEGLYAEVAKGRGLGPPPFSSGGISHPIS